MTNRELIAAIRKPGDIEMPVLAGDDVVHLVIRKSDLIDNYLVEADPDAEANWAFYETAGAVRRLDVA